MKFLYSFVIILCICTSCNLNSLSEVKKKKEVIIENTQDTLKSFVLPEIPIMYNTPEERVNFLVKHYWDNFDFTDTSYIHLPDVTEQAFVDFLDIINRFPMASIGEGIRNMMSKAEVDRNMFDYFVSLTDNYLYDPNSPFRNEELYIICLESILESKLLDETEKTRPQYRLQLAQKNRLGTKAINFTYTVASGKQGNLYGISTEYTLLYFNTPGCQACDEITKQLKESPIITQLLDEKHLTILCFYPDEEFDEWRAHQKVFPSTWINSYDKSLTLRDKELYDLRAIPSLYLLSKDKTVLLKDATFEQTERFFL